VKFISRQRAASLTLPFIIADLALLPIFHVGDVPWKPSLLLILYVALAQVRRRDFSKATPAIPISLLSGVLVAATVVGALVYWAVAGPTPGTETLRLLMILVLIPVSFLVGFSDRRNDHSYAGLIIIAMVAINLALFVAPDQMSSIASFYGLDKAYESAAYDPKSSIARPAGIFLNSNISGLAITILTTYLVLGMKWGFFRANSVLLTLFLSTSLFGVLMLLGRTQLAVALPIAISAFLWGNRSQRIAVAASIFIALILSGIIPSPVASATESFIGFDISERVGGKVSQVIDVAFVTSFSTPTPAIAPTEEPSPVPTATTVPEQTSTPVPTATTVPEQTSTPVPTATTVPEDDSYKVLFSPLARPFISWERARNRITDPVWMLLTGTGPEVSPKHGSLSYHNDWISMLVSGGILGLVSYAALVAYFGSVSLLLALPFFLPGVVNAFLFSPQFVILVSILAGIVMRHKVESRRARTHDLDVVLIGVDHGLSIDNSPVLKSQLLGAAVSLTNGGYTVGLLANLDRHDSAPLAQLHQQLAHVRTVHSRALPMMIFSSAWQLYLLNRKHSISTLYVRGIWGAIIARLAFPFFDGPELIYDFRGDIVAEAKYTGTSGPRLLVLRLLTQLAIRSANSHMSVSREGARKLEKTYRSSKVTVIPSSTDIQKFESAHESRSEIRAKLGFEDDDVVLVYAGGLARYQMIPEMLSVWAELAQPGIKFLLLTSKQPGHNIGTSELDALIPDGTIVQSLDPEDVPAYLAAADIGFLLRQPDPLNSVASPVKFAEYIAAGLAVVTSPALDDASTQVTENELGVVMSPQPSENELESLKIFVQGFSEHRDQIRERAIALAQTRYDWNAHLELWRNNILNDGPE
jgi:glycosyltransferase involved in cell wall biosynthesis